jgi:hypothetical protein
MAYQALVFGALSNCDRYKQIEYFACLIVRRENIV